MNEHQVTTVRAIVRAVDKDVALVEVEQGGCGRCHEEGGCGGQHLTQMFCSGPKTYRVDNGVSAEVGEHVVVAIEAGSVRRVANLAYGLPLLATLLGAAIGNALWGNAGGVGGALCGLVGAFAWVRVKSAGRSGKFERSPYIVSRS